MNSGRRSVASLTCQSLWWMGRWWKPHKNTPLSRLVTPPSIQEMMWRPSHPFDGRSHDGNGRPTLGHPSPPRRRPGIQPLRPPETQDLSLPAQDRRDDQRIARQPPRLTRTDLLPRVEGADTVRASKLTVTLSWGRLPPWS